jgi:hypothetical protein
VLQGAKYLSAVSGGSYIATAMTLARRSASDPFAPGSPEERYLRNRTTYLVPHGNEGVFLGYRMAIGIAINVLLLALALGIGAILLGLFYDCVGISSASGDLSAKPVAARVVAGIALASIVLALAYLVLRFGKRYSAEPAVARGPDPCGDDAPEGPELWRLTLQTWVVRLFQAAVVAAFVLLLVPELVDWWDGEPVPSNAEADGAEASGAVKVALPAASVATFVAALLSQLLAKPPKEVADRAVKLTKAAMLRPKLLRALAGVAATVAVPLLALVWIVVVVAWTVSPDDAGAISTALIGGSVLLGLICWRGDLTSWSLHPFYRSRLASVFALRRDGDRARALDTYREIPPIRDIQPDTGKKPRERWPELVVCAAANVSDPGATPHGRRVTSFTFSAEAIGGPLVGYVPAAEYETRFDHVRSDAMTAVAVSGAALSPSMGKLTYRSGRALLALANARLGVWMPNPRNTPEKDEEPNVPKRPRPYRLLWEMLGKNTLLDRYLYVSDGGHYENLGLVELLRRGCTKIYCFDGGGGRGLGKDLGDAIAIARSELGVEIEAEAGALEPNEDGIADADTIVANVFYPDRYGNPRKGPKGKLVYCRQLLTEKMPHDVRSHAAANPKFPHDPTTDQFLTDQSFESYRALGTLAAGNALIASTYHRPVRRPFRRRL